MCPISDISVGKMLAWQSRGVSSAIQMLVLGGLQLYSTNALGLDAALVGTLLMVGVVIDAVCVLFGGYIVDRTNTRWGRGRPYELCLIGLWVSTWILFSAPAEASILVKSIWVFTAHAFARSLFSTLLGASNVVYMVRAFNNEQAYIKINSIGSLIVVSFTVVFNLIFPMIQAEIIFDAQGWSRMVGFIAIPMTIIGMMRFIFIKEDKNIDAHAAKVNFKDVIAVLKHNKYIYLVAFAIFAQAVFVGKGLASYYYIYVVGNLAVFGPISLVGVFAMFSLLFYPALLKIITPIQLVQIGLLLAIPAGILNFIAVDNLILLAIAFFINGLSSLPITNMNGLLVIDCALYNEWQGRPRMEGTLASVVGFASRIGQAFGVFMLGILLSATGFDGTLDVQSESATMMIRYIFAFNPVVWSILAALVLTFFKMDKKKIIKELEKGAVTK